MNESQLRQISNLAKVVSVLTLILVVQTATKSQTTSTFPSDLSQTLIMIRNAETSGARQSELSNLTVPLNSAVGLYQEADNLSPQKSTERAQLVAQASQILAEVRANATYLASVASERTYLDTVLTYTGAALAAAIGTALYAVAISFYRKSRIRRTLQMRITRK